MTRIIPVMALLLGACGQIGTLQLSPLTGTDGGTTNPVSWKTDTVSLAADDFWIVANGEKFTGRGADVSLNSDEGALPTYTTLEMIWMEQGVEMRLFIYFTAGPSGWSVTEMRTYNGQPNATADWLYYEGPFFASPIGATYRGTVDLTNAADDPYRGELHLHGLALTTTLTGQ